MFKVSIETGVSKRKVEELTADSYCVGFKRGMDAIFWDFHEKIANLEANGESITFEALKSWYPEVNK